MTDNQSGFDRIVDAIKNDWSEITELKSQLRDALTRIGDLVAKTRRMTVDDVMALAPCYTREKVEQIADGRESMGPLDVLDLDIPPADRIWLVVRMLDRAVVVELACRWAERALRFVPDGEDRPRMAIETAWRWCRGEATIGEVDAASCDAAAYAAYAACDACDTSAAYAAHAAHAAAHATYAAASAAHAAYAASAAAYAGYERAEQIKIAREFLI